MILFHCHSNHGGKSNAKCGQPWVIRAVDRAFGSVSHRLLEFSSCFPRTPPPPPQSTTFSHILAVSRLLSSRNFEVRPSLGHRLEKLRRLVVNHRSDH